MQLARDMLDSQVVVLEGGEPSGYSSIHFSRVFPKGEVGVVCEDCDWGFCGC